MEYTIILLSDFLEQATLCGLYFQDFVGIVSEVHFCNFIPAVIAEDKTIKLGEWKPGKKLDHQHSHHQDQPLHFEILVYKPWRPRRFSQFRIIINVFS